MKVSELIGPFLDDSCYRLVQVRTIEKKNNHAYVAILVFQRLSQPQNEGYLHADLTSLTSFHLGKTEVRECPLAYLRIFVIGSIWHNRTDVPILPKPTYSKRYLIKDASFLTGTIDTGLITSMVEAQNLPIYRTIKDPSDKSIKKVPFESYAIRYNLEQPFYHHKGIENTIPLQKNKPSWKTDVKTEFLIFHSYEIYRYFLTAYGISDLNTRLLSSDLKSEQENKIYVPESTFYNPDFNQFLVHLKYRRDLKQTWLIGNVASMKKYRELALSTAQHVNMRLNPIEHIKELPIDQFKELQVIADRVKGTDGRYGLVIYEIQKCTGYQNYTYRPIVPMPQHDETDKKPTGGNGGSRKPKSGKTDETEPEIIRDETANPKKPHEVEGDWNIMFISNDEHDVTPPMYKHYSEDDGFFLDENENDNEVAPPGDENPKPGKHSTKEKIPVDPTDYFSFFPEIVEGIIKYIEKEQYKCVPAYLNENFVFDEQICYLIEREVKDLDADGDQIFYVIQLTVSSVRFTDERYLYLFAQRHESKISSQGRTWLYSLDQFICASTVEDIPSLLQIYLYKDRNSNPKRKEPDLRFNHLSSKAIGPKGAKKTYIKVDIEDAKKNHVEKIGKKIVSALL